MLRPLKQGTGACFLSQRSRTCHCLREVHQHSQLSYARPLCPTAYLARAADASHFLEVVAGESPEPPVRELGVDRQRTGGPARLGCKLAMLEEKRSKDLSREDKGRCRGGKREMRPRFVKRSTFSAGGGSSISTWVGSPPCARHLSQSDTRLDGNMSEAKFGSKHTRARASLWAKGGGDWKTTPTPGLKPGRRANG